MKLKILFFILLLVIFNSAKAESPHGVNYDAPMVCGVSNVSEDIKNYLCHALDIIHKNSLYRDQTNWKKFYKDVYKKASGTRNLNEANSVIRYALKLLGDHHGYLEIRKDADPAPGAEPQDDLPTSRLILDKLVYLEVTPITQTGAQAAYYAEHLQNLIQNMNTLNPCGWIVDLRHNQSTEIWPMLLGLAPLLGDGTLGMFVYPNGSKQSWGYRNNKVTMDGRVILELPSRSIALSPPQPNIIVLTGHKTLGAAEAIAIAFKGLPNVQAFGMQTGGLSTHTESYQLSDKVNLHLATAKYGDRTGKVYGGEVTPEEFVISDGADNDFSVLKASRWLLNQPVCMG